ncbi:hypothetical protein C0J52_26508 [Blattella germanica]|nr:hypothetical protein C0J52_26508 [Blattella germanica]
MYLISFFIIFPLFTLISEKWTCDLFLHHCSVGSLIYGCFDYSEKGIFSNFQTCSSIEFWCDVVTIPNQSVIIFIFRSLRLFVVNLFADELVHEKEKYKYICDDLDMTFTELIGN